MNTPFNEETMTDDNMKSLLIFIYEPIVPFIDHYLDVDVSEYLKLFLPEGYTHVAYSRELDGEKYDIIIKNYKETNTFNHDILKSIPEDMCRHLLLCYISSTIATIKYIFKKICVKENIDYKELEKKIKIDDNLNVYIEDNSKESFFININIFNGTKHSKTVLLQNDSTRL